MANILFKIDLAREYSRSRRFLLSLLFVWYLVDIVVELFIACAGVRASGNQNSRLRLFASLHKVLARGSGSYPFCAWFPRDCGLFQGELHAFSAFKHA